jgi:hypothetical protein
MSVVYHFINDLVDEHKVFADALFVEHSTVVSKDLHHSVDDVHDKGG